MTGVETALRQLVSDAHAAAIAPFALIGGFAVSARSEPRFTRDVDLAVAAPDDTTAEALVRALSARGYRLVSTVEQTAVHRAGRPSGPGDPQLFADICIPKQYNPV